LPPIPSSTLDMGDGTHSDDDTIYPPIKAISPSTSPVQSVRASSSRHSHDGSRDFRHRVPTADELIVLWGKIGTRVIAHAEELVETSKKSVIGDGSAEGFVRAVLDHVPEALQNDSEYGYLIYSQNGTSVLKRASDIMPGDVIAIQDARFKGHRGLSAYSWHVGTGDVPLVGIIHDFEGKKSKVRVFQAAMHPNSYPVSSVLAMIAVFLV
jgi:myosin tail region-interacting protein MTI1